MTIIELKNNKIIRPDTGKKLKLKNSNVLYDEIVVSKDSTPNVEEVSDNVNDV